MTENKIRNKLIRMGYVRDIRTDGEPINWYTKKYNGFIIKVDTNKSINHGFVFFIYSYCPAGEYQYGACYRLKSIFKFKLLILVNRFFHK